MTATSICCFANTRLNRVMKLALAAVAVCMLSYAVQGGRINPSVVADDQQNLVLLSPNRVLVNSIDVLEEIDSLWRRSAAPNEPSRIGHHADFLSNTTYFLGGGSSIGLTSLGQWVTAPSLPTTCNPQSIMFTEARRLYVYCGASSSSSSSSSSAELFAYVDSNWQHQVTVGRSWTPAFMHSSLGLAFLLGSDSLCASSNNYHFDFQSHDVVQRACTQAQQQAIAFPILLANGDTCALSLNFKDGNTTMTTRCNRAGGTIVSSSPIQVQGSHTDPPAFSLETAPSLLIVVLGSSTVVIDPAGASTVYFGPTAAINAAVTTYNGLACLFGGYHDNIPRTSSFADFRIILSSIRCFNCTAWLSSTEVGLSPMPDARTGHLAVFVPPAQAHDCAIASAIFVCSITAFSLLTHSSCICLHIPDRHA